MPHVITSRRKVSILAEEYHRKSSKARLFAFGLRSIAALTGQSLVTIRRHSANGRLDTSSLATILAYVNARSATITHPKP